MIPPPKLRTRVSERVTPLKSEQKIIDLLIMSISCIAFLRGFFTDKHFKDDVFELQGESPSTYNSKKETIKIKRLELGVSDEADMIINWITNSIMDALHKRYLKSINLSIVLDDKNPTDVFESYSFDINYGDTSAASITMNDDMIVSPIEMTKMQIFKLLKRFIIITQSLPALPPKRFLFMRFLCNERCPDDYYTENFTNCTNEKSATMKIPISTYSDLLTNCGDVNSVHHIISTSLLSLSSLDEKYHQSNEQLLEIDPFDILKSNKTLPDIDSEVSQITKELYQMVKTHDDQLHDGLTQVPPLPSLQEEITTTIECSCKSHLYLPYSSILQCSKCFKSLHKICFSSNSNSEDFICNNCQTTMSDLTSNELCILFNIRKLLAYLQYNKHYTLKSLKDTALLLGYTADDLKSDDSILRNLVNSFNVLLYEGILSLKAKKSFSHNVFYVDVDGLLNNNTQVKKGKYFISFVIKNKQANIDRFVDPNLESQTVFDSIANSIHDHYSQMPEENSYKRRKPSSDIFKF